MEQLSLEFLVNNGAIGLIAFWLSKALKTFYEDTKKSTEQAINEYKETIKHYEESQKKLIECISSFKQSQKEITETLTEIVERLEKLDNRVCNIEGGKEVE